MTAFIIAVVLVLAYPIIASVILRASEGVRLELAAVGKDLLASPSVSEDQKQFISDLLDDVFDWRFMAFSCFYFPYSLAIMVMGRGPALSRQDKEFFCDDRVNRFFDLHMKAAYAAAPLWTLVFWVIAALTIAAGIILLGFSALSHLWIDSAHNVAARVPPSAAFQRVDGR